MGHYDEQIEEWDSNIRKRELEQIERQRQEKVRKEEDQRKANWNKLKSEFKAQLEEANETHLKKGS